MNRYPLWKYVFIALVLLLAGIYSLPNLFGEVPAVQIAAARSSSRVNAELQVKVAAYLAQQGIIVQATEQDGHSIRIRLADTDTQLRARDQINTLLNPDKDAPAFSVALNLVPASPAWLRALGAAPMYLGLDLRGGVHFLLQVDTAAVSSKRLDALLGDIRTQLREKNLRHSGISHDGKTLTIKVREAAQQEAIRQVVRDIADLQVLPAAAPVVASETLIQAQLSDAANQRSKAAAVQQNITTLHSRINELGVAEPVIQQQGADRIVVQLPGIQDTARAKDILGRTATLEVRLVDESGLEPQVAQRDGPSLSLKRDVILTGENLTDAQAGFDGQNHQPAVHLTLDGKGARIFREVTRENVNKRMAIILIERGRGEIITAPVIRDEIGGGRVQISGSMDTREASDLALLLRAGSLAAPMQIVEERTIGPSLGADNIRQGFHSTWYGLAVLSVFFLIYYQLFGLFSVLALTSNLVLLVSLLSILQATLTLPGIAAIALALGMAIDANVLINERIREELRLGASPHQAISTGFERAFATILDSNITTLIAGLALLLVPGAVRGFAVVHCLGILTSMFTAVLVFRAMVNLWYGSKAKLNRLAIGQIWQGGTH